MGPTHFQISIYLSILIVLSFILSFVHLYNYKGVCMCALSVPQASAECVSCSHVPPHTLTHTNTVIHYDVSFALISSLSLILICSRLQSSGGLIAFSHRGLLEIFISSQWFIWNDSQIYLWLFSLTTLALQSDSIQLFVLPVKHKIYIH